MILDIIVVLLVAFGFYLGFKRGLIKTVFNTLSLAIGILAALKFAPIVIRFVESIVNVSPAVNYLIGLVVTFLIVLGIIRLVGSQLERLLKAININFINQLAGGALQGLFFAFLLSMGLWLLNNLKILNPDLKEKSITYELLEPLPEKGKALFVAVRPIFEDFWSKTVDTFDRVKESAEKTQGIESKSTDEG